MNLGARGGDKKKKLKLSGHEQVENENERRTTTMATCCGIIVFTVWELIAIVAGLIALATNAWIVPQVCAIMNPLHATTTPTSPLLTEV